MNTQHPDHLAGSENQCPSGHCRCPMCNGTGCIKQVNIDEYDEGNDYSTLGIMSEPH